MNETESIPKIAFRKRRNLTAEFEILTLKKLFSARPKYDHHIDQPHRIQFFQLLFITEGEGVHYIDFQTYPYEKGSMFFLSAGQVQTFDTHPDTNGYVFLFTESFLLKNLIDSDMLSLDRLYNYHLHTPILHPAETAVLTPIINEMCTEYDLADSFAKEEILRLLLKLLLLKVERIKQTMIPQEQNSQWIVIFSTFRTLLQKQFDQTRNAKAYAEMVGVSYKHLNEICKAITGMTAKAFIDNFLILEMKRHLATSNNSIKELTYMLGFDEPTNFVKFFKRHTSQSPVQFRKSLTV